MMNPLYAVFRLSLAVLVRSKKTLFIGLLSFLPVLGPAVTTVLVLMGRGDTGLSSFTVVSFVIVYVYLPVMLVLVTLFYGTALISDELDEKTITYLFMRPISKTTIYLGKYLAYVVTSAMLLLPAAALCFLVAMPADPPGESAGHAAVMLKDLGMLALGILAYGALYALVGAVARRPVFVGIGFTVIWETLVSYIPGYLSKLTIKHYLLALVPHPVGQRGVLGLFETSTGPLTAITVLLLVTVALLALGSSTFTNKEYVLEQ